MTQVNSPALTLPAASPFTLILKQVSLANEEVQRKYHPNMIHSNNQSKPKEVPKGPRSHLVRQNWTWRKEINTADGKEDVMTADPRRAQKRSAAPGSPMSDSSARKVPRLETALDGRPNGAATPVSESASEDVFGNQVRASPSIRPERPPVRARVGSVELSHPSSPASNHSALSTVTETREVDKNAFAMTVPIEQLLVKSSDLGGARAKLEIAHYDHIQMIEEEESMVDRTAGFPAVQEQLEEYRSGVELRLQQAQETYDRLKTKLQEQIGLAFNNDPAIQCEDTANRVSRLESENNKLQKELQMQKRAHSKDIEELKSQVKLLQTSQKPAIDREQIVEVVEEKIAWERSARVNLEGKLTGHLAKVLQETEDWKSKSDKKLASTDKKAEDVRRQTHANERKVHQLETDLKEQSKKAELAKSTLSNLQTSVASLHGKNLEAVQRHETCLKMISDLETTVNERLEAVERREAEHANLSASGTVPEKHDASKIGALASEINFLKQKAASVEETAELRTKIHDINEWVEGRDDTLTTEIERLEGKVDYLSSRTNILEYEAKVVKHPAAPPADEGSVASLRAQVDALKDTQQQQHINSEGLQASVSELLNSQRNAPGISNDAKVQELIDKHDAQTDVTRRLQEQFDAFRQRLDQHTAYNTQRFREVAALLPTTNSPRVAAEVPPNARTATPPQGQQSPARAQANETQRLRTDLNGLAAKLNELIPSINSNNKEVRSRYTDQRDKLTQCKSDIQKALEKANAAHTLAEENRQATAEVQTNLARRVTELDNIVVRLAGLEDTKMKVEAALSALMDMQNGIRVSREATQRLELLSNGQQAKLNDYVRRQENMDARVGTLEDLEIANTFHTLEDRLDGARQSTGISISVVQDAITKIESYLDQSETNFPAMEKELKELRQLSAGGSPSAT